MSTRPLGRPKCCGPESSLVARFRYTAVDKSGKNLKGEHKAQDRSSLLAFLRTQGLTALDIEELDEDFPAPATKKMEAGAGNE